MIVTYDLATGRITGAHEIHGDENAYIERLAEIGQGGLRLGVDGHEYMVKDGAIQPRPDAGIAIDKTEIGLGPDDFATLSNVPAGAKLRIISASTVHEVEGTGEDLKLSFALPGVYEIQINAFPFKDKILRVSVTA